MSVACSKLHRTLWMQLSWDYCKIHLAQLRKGNSTKPCLICGKGVINKFLLCQAHGYENEKVKVWQQKSVAFNHECQRFITTQGTSSASTRSHAKQPHSIEKVKPSLSLSALDIQPTEWRMYWDYVSSNLSLSLNPLLGPSMHLFHIKAGSHGVFISLSCVRTTNCPHRECSSLPSSPVAPTLPPCYWP